jgi:formylglycine-generating enzyme required for sulfatase activity
MDTNPSYLKGDNYPVTNVSWGDAIKFCNRLNIATGKQYRLPTEAEWEYAARGGNQSQGYKYSGSNNLYNVGWFDVNSDSNIHIVGEKLPNELGIYDMSGNVWEWCNDWYSSYSSASQTNPTGPSYGLGSGRVGRGGSWRSIATSCRVSIRSNGNNPYNNLNDVGFRVVLVD